MKLVRRLDTGQEVIRDAGGPITRIQFGPKRLMPPIVAVMSPEAMRDVLGRSDASSDRCVIHDEVRNMAGDSLFVLPNEQWRPRKTGTATGVHQAQRPQLRRPHVAGGTAFRRPLASRRRCRPRRGVPPNRHAVVGPFGAGCRPQRTRRHDRQLHARGVVLHRRPRVAAGACSAMDADAGAPPRSCRGRGDAHDHRRDGAGLPSRPDPRRTAGAGPARGQRPGNRPADLRRRHLQRSADLHARRPRHHRDGAHLLTVGPWPPSRHPGSRRRRGGRRSAIGS